MEKNILLIGAGALGSHTAQQIQVHSRLGPERIGSFLVVDNQRFEAENKPKTANIIHFPDDVGKWKSQALAGRLREQGVNANSFVGSIELLGPLAISPFDLVIAAPDSIAVREYVNKLWKELPTADRPTLMIAGTTGDDGQLEFFGPASDSCYRCGHQESSYRRLIGVKTSCNDVPILHSSGEDYSVHSPVTPEAGARAATLITDFAVGQLEDPDDFAALGMYVRWRPALYALPIQGNRIRQREDCADCRTIRPPEKTCFIDGDCLHLTLQQFLEEIAYNLQTKEFYVETHLHRFDEGTFAGYLVSTFCHSCGRPVRIEGHSGRISAQALFCPACKAANKLTFSVTDGPHEEVYAFSFKSDRALMQKNLFELGYPIGSYYHIISEGRKRSCFALSGDRDLLIHDLNFMEAANQ